MNWRAGSPYYHDALTHTVAKVFVNGLTRYEAYRRVSSRCARFLGAFPDAVSAKKACSLDAKEPA